MRPASSRVITLRIAFLCLLAVLFSLGVSASAQTDTWTGKGSNIDWSSASNWNNGAITTCENILINLTSAATDVDQNFTVGTLTLSNAGDSATILNGVALTVEGNISNAGTITLGSTGGTTELQVGTSAGGANVILSGGTLVMSNNAPNYIFGVTGTDTLTNEETISGSGNIGNGQLTLVNSATGVINANGSAGMTIDANGGLTNTGTIEATGGSTLNLLNMGPQVGTTGITNTGGTILANASTLVVTSSTITGGTITLTGASTLELNNKRDHGRHADQRAHLSKH